MRRAILNGVLGSAVLCGGCSSYSPASLEKGASEQQAVQTLGPPTGEFMLPQGERRLEFARGPFGRHTFMLDFDAQGRLVRSEQVLTEARFADIHAGMDATQVLSLIGHPSDTYPIGWQKQTVWAYRYVTPFCQWFQVGLDTQNKVVDTAYGPDPMCDRDRGLP